MLSSDHRTDLSGTLQRIAAQAAERLTDPTARQRDPSPLHHGRDTQATARRLMREAGGDRRVALKIHLAETRQRHPAFKASDPCSPGFLGYDRVRSFMYRHY